MAEVNNLHVESMVFHPIHCTLFGPCWGFEVDFMEWLRKNGMELVPYTGCEPDL